MILLEQREEENRQEIAKLTAEIKALKVQLLQHRSKLNLPIYFVFIGANCDFICDLFNPFLFFIEIAF